MNKFIFVLGFPDPLDLATGIEKKEMLLRLAGNDVRFFFSLLIGYDVKITNCFFLSINYIISYLNKYKYVLMF